MTGWREMRERAVAESQRLRDELPAHRPVRPPQLGLTVPVRCPRNGHPMRFVQAADPRGWVDRERRAVVQCTVPHCSHTAVIEVHLIDVAVGNPAATDRKRRSRAKGAA